MCGEWQYSGDMANIFASVNRQGYLGADVGKLDIFIGAAHRIAELNGVADAPHVRDKITQMIKLQALIWSTGVAASMHATVMEPGVAVPDAVYANTGKHVAMEGHYLATRLLLEIAGGAVETLPAIEDQRAPELKPYFDKYYAGATGTAEERMRLFRFIRDLTASEYAGLVGRGDHPRLGVAGGRVAPDVPGVRPRPRREARGRPGHGAVTVERRALGSPGRRPDRRRRAARPSAAAARESADG